MKSMLKVVLLLCASPVTAQANEALAQKHACTACHQADRKVIGPSWKDIATKHKGGDAAKLAARIKSGSSGVWGPIPMPPQGHVPDDELRELARWILTLG